MKKVITIISCCIIIFSIGGCMNREKYMSDWFTSEQEEADKMMEQIIEACRKQDTQKLKELFSENSRKNIKNIDVKINELFQYLKGDIQTFEGDCASSSDSDHGKKIIELDGMYNISTSSEKYHMNFYMYSQNDSDSKQPDEEWNPLFAEALHKKNYIEYLLDILLYGSLEERKALVAEQRKEVLKLEQRIAELSADRTMHSRRNPKQLRAERER